MIENVKANLFEPQLQAGGEVFFARRERRAWLARRAACCGILIREEAPADRRAVVPGHLDAFRVVTEVIEVELEVAALFCANDVAEGFNESRLAVRSEPHNFAFVA